ncbi:MAG: HEPN domain-containing protein [Candidatus Cloacimonetes bacterium]|nr:HEPN domain-containing protein [Candidatus Cloacimonadota bacterium]
MDRTTDLAKYRLEKSRDDYDTAKLNFEHHKFAQSINRSYYAMFHAARALLALDKFDSSKHSGIISYFNRYYIKTGKIDKIYSSMLMNAFNVRQNCDYDDFYIISKNDCEIQLNNADKFIQMIDSELGKRTRNEI